MKVWRCVPMLLAVAAILVAAPAPAPAQAFSGSGDTAQAAIEKRDGQHDFDFEFGTWKTHLKRLQHPLTGSNDWVEYDGTTAVRKIWDGRANLLELEADGTAGHIEALSLRLYNAQAHQWNLNFASAGAGSLSQPTYGEFKNGRGEFYDQEPFKGRAILVRFIISDITPDSCHFEQAFSDDGGKTWEVNWIATDTRVKNETDMPKASQQPNPALTAENHDFDFEIGSWKIHLKRLDKRLAGSHNWIDFDGTSVTRRVWNGRSQIEEFETASRTDHIEGLTLRLFNPQTHQWSLYWANSKDGMLGGPPNIGEFKNGVGQFLTWDTWQGRYVLMRFLWTETNSPKPHFEQSFSDDGGKTWEVNWITDQTRTE